MIYRFCLSLLLICLSAVSATALAEQLRIAVGGDTPALFTLDTSTNQPSGFNADIAYALCEEMQADCVLTAVQPQQAIAALLDNAYDAVVASLPIVETPDEEVAFTDRYYKNGVKFIRRKGDKTRISYKGLAAKFVGVEQDTLTDMFLTAAFDGVAIRRYPNAADLYNAIQQGEVDYIVAEQFQQAAWVAEKDEFQLSGPTYNSSKYFSSVGIALRQQDDALRQRLNAAITTIRHNRVYRTINKKYFPFSIYGR